MAPTSVAPPQTAPSSGAGIDGASSSVVNSFRVLVVADRLAIHVRSGQCNDPTEFYNLCLALARGIDYAVANNEVPTGAQDLPLLLKLVCQLKTDYVGQTAIMVLMISVKNACKIGWFSDKDKEELLKLADERGSIFCTGGDINTDPNHSIPIVSKIMSRFYPRIKIAQVLASLEVKSGYGAHMVDFHISKNATSTPEQKIRLLVAQTDNIETSACIISPQQVNILLNGKGVEKRTNVSMDQGPQIPTNVTSILKYGTNLLQAVGQFNGHYVIVVAFMTVTSTPDSVVLQDYVQPVVSTQADSEIIEGASRISLNCPISYRRIKTPVKGYSCKHHQCFDFNNYVDINSRRPSWRCPHCNQYVCYSDMRIDRYMVKVLSEVGDNVADVIISADGSWKTVAESNDHAQQPQDKTINLPEERSEQDEIVMDLTDWVDEMDVEPTRETEDRKPSKTSLQNHSVPENQPPQPTQIEDDFWSGIYLSALGSEGPTPRSGAPVSETSSTNLMPLSVLTDAVSPTPDEDFRGSTHLTTSSLENQFRSPNNMQLQPSQFVQSLVSHEYGRLPAVPRNVTRTPIAVQALPAQGSTPTPPQRSRTVSSQASSSSLVPILDSFNIEIDRQHQFSRAPPNPGQGSSHHRSTQNWDHQERISNPNQSVPHIVGLAAPTQNLGKFRVSHDPQNPNTPPNNTRMPPHIANQSPSMMRSYLFRTPGQQGSPQGGPGYGPSSNGVSQSARHVRPPHMSRQTPSVPINLQASPRVGSSDGGIRSLVGEQRSNMGETAQPVSRPENSIDLGMEQNWRPTGRMRGSLSGQAYSAALREFMTQPTPAPAQAGRAHPTSLESSPAATTPSQLHSLVSNNRNPHASQNRPSQ